MKSIINLFWGICLLRQNPALVPAYGWFVTLVVVTNLLFSTLISLSFDARLGFLQTLTSIIVGQTVTASLAWLVLSSRNLADRFTTTITALFGCDLIITACFAAALPVINLLGPGGSTVGFLMFLLWSVAVAGFILHHALSVRLAIGIGLALGMSLLSVTFSQLAIGA